MTSMEFFSLIAVSTVSVLLFITQRRYRQLQQEQQRLQAIFAQAAVGLGQLDTQGNWLDANAALARMIGQPNEALAGQPLETFVHPDDQLIWRRQHSLACTGQHPAYALEIRFLRADGCTLFVNLSGEAIRQNTGTLDRFLIVIEDITQRQLAEQQYIQQVDRAALLLELPHEADNRDEEDFLDLALARLEQLTGSSLGFIRFIHADPAHAEAPHWSAKGRAIDPAQRPEIGPELEQRTVNASSQGKLLLCIPVLEEGRLRMLTGVAGKNSDYTPYDLETVQLVANLIWRIIRRQRIDRSLHQAMQVVDASPVVCFRWAPCEGWPVIFVSANVIHWGYTPEQLQQGQPDFASLVHPDDLARVTQEVSRHTAAGEDVYDQEYRLVTKDQRVIWVSDHTQIRRDENGKILHYDGALTDITEQYQQRMQIAETLAQQQKLNRRLEEANNQLLQSEKMASIGQLAAGIAHELNNPIGFVHSNLGTLDGYLNDMMAIVDAYDATVTTAAIDEDERAALLRLREERDFAFVRDDVFKLLDESKEGLARMRKIVLDLKSFAHVGEQEWQEADLHQGIDSTLNIVWNELKYKCEVVKDYGDLPPVFCLISQLNQVFMNLLVNAGHAIETRGTITLRTRRLGDQQVSIEVIDTGIGIPPERVNRIFEPFFTTKPVGKGTGLGLSVSYGIIQRHQGRIEVESTPGQGTTFRVILPIHPTPAAAPENAP